MKTEADNSKRVTNKTAKEDHIKSLANIQKQNQDMKQTDRIANPAKYSLSRIKQKYKTRCRFK